MVLTIVSIVVLLVWVKWINNPHIVDTNGADTTLVEIDLSEPVNINEFEGAYTNKTERFTDHSTTFSAKKFSGTKLLRTIHTFGDEAVLIEFDVILLDGNAEMVVVNNQGEIVHTVLKDGKSSVILPANGETYFVILGAESAELVIDVDV